jgi:hypothetical protein
MASAALIAATPAEEKQPHSEESDDDEEPEAEEKAASSSPPQQADDNDDDGDDDDDDDDGTSFTTLLFSDRGTRLPHWTVETDESFNESLGNRALLPTWKPEYQPTVKQLQEVFDNYRTCIITNTLETYLLFLSWVSHIQDIDDDDEKLVHGAALQDFIRDVEHISDKKGSLSAVGNRILVAAYIWMHNPVWEWWDERRSRVSVKMIASCTVKAITDEFLLGRLMRILVLNEHTAKAEISQLAKDIVEEDGIEAWDIKAKTLIFHVFDCDNWVEATVKQAKERQWIKATTLREHKRWTDICDKKEKAIRALTIVSIGTVAKKAGRVDTFEVVFSNKESLWLSHDNIKALDVKQWARVLDKDKAAPVEEKKDEAKEQSQLTLEQQKVVDMEAKLEEEHQLRVQEHQLRIEAEKKLQLLLQERAKERAEQLRRQRLQQRDRARETAQLLEKLRGLSARMPKELRQEVLQLVRTLQGKQPEKPADEAKEAPQLLAAAEEVKEAPPEPAEDDAEHEAAADDAAEHEAAADDAAEHEAAADDAAEDDAADDAAEDDAADDAAEDDVAAATPPPAIGSKRKDIRGTANAGKKQRR